jgi:AcrR family transcriptional regulator
VPKSATQDPIEQRSQRRQKIVETASKLFSQLGYADCDMDRLAAKLRIAKGTIYLYVASKEELFLACVDWGMSQMQLAVREAAEGYRDISADERLTIYRRYVKLAKEHWGADDHGRERLREFLRWHVGFWCRYAPQRPDGTWPTMQQRESVFVPRSPLEALLARTDDPALDYVTDRLLDEEGLAEPPPAGGSGWSCGTPGLSPSAADRSRFISQRRKMQRCGSMLRADAGRSAYAAIQS